MLLFKPLGLWSSVTAARADEHGDREMGQKRHTQQQQEGLAGGNTAHGPATTVCTPRKLRHGKASAANGEWMTSRVAQRACDSRRAGWARSPPQAGRPLCARLFRAQHTEQNGAPPLGGGERVPTCRSNGQGLGEGPPSGDTAVLSPSGTSTSWLVYTEEVRRVLK